MARRQSGPSIGSFGRVKSAAVESGVGYGRPLLVAIGVFCSGSHLRILAVVEVPVGVGNPSVRLLETSYCTKPSSQPKCWLSLGLFLFGPML
jgi:hypothetical protein